MVTMTPVSFAWGPGRIAIPSSRLSGKSTMKFDTRHASHPSIIPTANSARLRELYHVSGIFIPDDVSLTFSHIERMINGGVMPVTKAIELNEVPALNKGPFLARREL